MVFLMRRWWWSLVRPRLCYTLSLSPLLYGSGAAASRPHVLSMRLRPPYLVFVTRLLYRPALARVSRSRWAPVPCSRLLPNLVVRAPIYLVCRLCVRVLKLRCPIKSVWLLVPSCLCRLSLVLCPVTLLGDTREKYNMPCLENWTIGLLHGPPLCYCLHYRPNLLGLLSYASQHWQFVGAAYTDGLGLMIRFKLLSIRCTCPR